MRIKNTTTQLIFRTILVIFGLISTVFTITDHIPGIGDNIPTTLYFTTWSVWFSTAVAVYFYVVTIVRKAHKQTEAPKEHAWAMLLKFSSNIMIIATFIISTFVLKISFDSVGSNYKHFILPMLAVADTVLFDQKSSYKVYYPFVATIPPLLYWIVVLGRVAIKQNECGGHIPASEWQYYYPYGFTNVDNGHSWGGLIGLLAGILVGLIVLGFIFWLIDKCVIENKKIVLRSSK